VRGFLALAAVIAIGAAFAEGHYGLAIGGALFVVLAVILGYKAWRVRQELGTDSSPRRPQ
jgi:membrane-associated phospholipid phosphatase